MDRSRFKSKSNSFNQKELSVSNEREKTKLTLRKNTYMQRYLTHILQSFDDTSEYELSEKDFNGMNGTMNDISNINNNMTINQNYSSLAFWLFSVRKALSETISSSSCIIKSLSQDQVNSLVDIIVTYPLDSKLKYEACWILINLVVETDDFNDFFLLRIKEIYNHLSLLISNDAPTNKSFVIIRHIQWFLANLIQERDLCNQIREQVNIPLLIQSVFSFVKLNYSKDVSLFSSQMNLMIEVNMQMLDFFLANTDNKQLFQFKSFLSDIVTYIKYSFNSNLTSLLKESLEPLYNFTFSLECIELIVADQELIDILVKTFDGYETGQLILITIIKNTKNSTGLIQKNDIIDKIVLPVLKSSQNSSSLNVYSSKVIENIIKLINAITSFDSFGYLIEKMVTDANCLGIIQKLFHQHDIGAKCNILIMYRTFFRKASEPIKNILIKVNLHIFIIQELKNLLDNQSKQQSGEIYLKSIKTILELFSDFLLFGEKDKINYIQKALENEDITEILTQLQYNKEESIYERAVELLNIYWKEEEDYIEK